MAEDRRCRVCTYSVPMNETDATCQRIPPVPIRVPGAEGAAWEVRSFWPTVSLDATCGEFKRRVAGPVPVDDED